MSTDSEAQLDAVRKARADYQEYVAHVDAELRRQRELLLEDARNSVGDLVASAYARGATIAELKRAYGTSDHGTIRKMLDDRAVFIANIREAIGTDADQPVESKWFEMNVVDGIVTIFDDESAANFEVISLDPGEWMLSLLAPESGLTPSAVAGWDGAIVRVGDSDKRYNELARAIEDADRKD